MNHKQESTFVGFEDRFVEGGKGGQDHVYAKIKQS